MQKKFSERLKLALNRSGLNQQKFADTLQISKQLISHYVNERSYPQEMEMFFPMAKILNVNPAWLAGFDVPMDNLVITDREIMLLKSYKKLNDSGKAKIDENINDLTQLEKYTAKDDYSFENEKKPNFG